MRPLSIRLAGVALAAVIVLPATAPAALAQAATSTESSSAVEADAAERELFALNLYHEARSEGRDGMVAVAWVVLNRVSDPDFPDTITAVINQPTRRGCQWGWTCDGRSDAPTEMDKWALAEEVSDVMLSSARPADPTGGAVFFQETFRQTPGWLSNGATRTATIGDHHFYATN
jgi:spore germination cell wall hydrolase CwlJ-like protein